MGQHQANVPDMFYGCKAGEEAGRGTGEMGTGREEGKARRIGCGFVAGVTGITPNFSGAA
jgi:hypothetical protein